MYASDCVLLHGDAFSDHLFHGNATTATATTSSGFRFKLSLSCPERPLLPTILFVSSPGRSFTDERPRIIRVVEDLVLLRVPMDRRGPAMVDEYDYFIYRPGGKKASLELLPRPHTMFPDEDVGLLRRTDGQYTVAALLPASNAGMYELHRFHSVIGRWSIDEVPLVEPQASFPRKIPTNSTRLLFHLTSTVIPIGGDGGTMAWVDLWHGILLCDVLSTEPKLRGVPLPLPMELLDSNNGQGADLGCPKSRRGITVINKPGMGPCLKFIHLKVKAVPIRAPADSDDDEPVFPEWRMIDWTITTWSNQKMTSSWEDWHQDCELKASDTSISSKLKSKMLKSGLLSSEEAEPKRAFQNLLVSFPAPGMDDNVVYLHARVKFLDPKVFVLAIDTSSNKLIGAVEFGTEKIPGTGVPYFPSNVRRYIDPEARALHIPKDDDSWEESSKFEGTDFLELPRFVMVLPLKDGRSPYVGGGGPSLEQVGKDGPGLGDVTVNDAGIAI